MQGKVSSKQASTVPVYVGIDVCKEWLDIHVHPLGLTRRLSNNREGIGQLVSELSGLEPVRIIMEATNTYHRLAHRSLDEAGLPVGIVDPCRARHFARYVGLRAKTDRLDARMLALMAQSEMIPPAPPPSPEIEQIKELVQARAAAHGELTGLKNRLASASLPFLKAELRRLIGVLERHVDRLDEAIAEAIAADPALARKLDILTSIPGIGTVTAHALIAGMAELGSMTGKQAAMLAGLAPIAHDSGAHSAPRSIRGGRPAPRRALYMASLAACRHNPALKAFAANLKAAGKQPKVILVAVMRKLVVLANTLLAQNRIWTPNPP